MNTQGQSNKWQDLADAVREELRECAWLLSLLTDQQKAILNRDVNQLSEVSDSIAEQNRRICALRDQRVGLMSGIDGMARLLSAPDGSLMELEELMPDAMRPMFGAMTSEAASLRRRIRHRTEQNHRILERASRSTVDLLDYARPGSMTRTYGRAGTYQTSSGLKGRMIHTTV